MKTAIILIRVSGDRQIDGTSLGTQEADCLAFARREGFTVIEPAYRDEGESAKTMDRPGLLSALARVKQGGISALIVWKLDRWARNTTEGLVVKAELLRHGCKLVSATEPLSDDPAGEFMTTVLLGVAQLDNAVRSARSKRSMQAIALAGGWPHKAPCGYRHAILGRQARAGGLPLLVPVEPQASALRTAFESVAHGSMSLADAVRHLATVGICHTSVCRAFRQTIYGGVIQGPLTAGKPIPAAFPGLVSYETFLLASARLRKYAPRRPRDDEWLLCGVAKCAVCGRPVRGANSIGKTGARYAYYDCRGGHVRAKASAAHLVLSDLLRTRWLPSVKGIRAIVARNVQTVAKNGEKMAAAADRRRAVSLKRLSKLTDGWTDGVIDSEVYRVKSAALKVEIESDTIKAHAHKEASAKVLEGIDRICEAMIDPLLMWRTLSRQGRTRLSEILDGGLIIDRDGTCRTRNTPKNPSNPARVRQEAIGATTAQIVETARMLIEDVLPQMRQAS